MSDSLNCVELVVSVREPPGLKPASAAELGKAGWSQYGLHHPWPFRGRLAL